jgi:thiamine pyrophosphate-dependent acetolactate synthase large subunit-like protein
MTPDRLRRREPDRLRRREVVAAMLEDRGDLLVVSGLGSPTWDCAAAGDHPLTFSLWGGMGLAAMTGLGLAMARPHKRVLVITGDGEALMGMGSLATIGVQQPPNLSIVILDNGRYGETGMQPSHTAFGVDLAEIARGCTLPDPRRITSMDEISGVREAIHRRPGPNLFVVAIAPEKLPLVLPPRDGVLLKNRFREALS